MQIALAFNRPPGEEKIEVTFGEQNDDDAGRKFRVGVAKPGEPGEVHWSLLGWIAGTEQGKLAQLGIEAERGDVIRVEREDEDGTVTFFEVDTGENWPPDAWGSDEVTRTWGFAD